MKPLNSNQRIVNVSPEDATFFEFNPPTGCKRVVAFWPYLPTNDRYAVSLTSAKGLDTHIQLIECQKGTLAAYKANVNFYRNRAANPTAARSGFLNTVNGRMVEFDALGQGNTLLVRTENITSGKIEPIQGVKYHFLCEF